MQRWLREDMVPSRGPGRAPSPILLALVSLSMQQRADSCPMLRDACDISSTTWSASTCQGNSACAQCSFGSAGSATGCNYTDPVNGNGGAALGSPLTLCTSSYVGAGGCTASNVGSASPVAVSCAAVMSGLPSGQLSGGQLQVCCSDLTTPGWMPPCPAGSTSRLQLNLDVASTTSTCMPGCNAGYQLSLTQQLTTCSNGVLTLAQCEPLPCSAVQVQQAAAPTNGGAGNCTGQLQSGQVCQPVCNQGFTPVRMNDPTNSTAICIAGQFTPVVCDQGKCTVGAPPANATSGNCGQQLSPGQSCQPTCNTVRMHHVR